MPDNTTNTKSEDPQYIIETLKAKDKDKQLYYIYPVTKEGAITDRNGMNLEEKLINILERITTLEELLTNNQFYNIPFSVTFDCINNISVEGNGSWNVDDQKIQF